MPCGCSKGRKAPLPQNTVATVGGKTAARVAVYEVTKDSMVVLSTTSPSAARGEAKRVGGSVRVTSRPVEPALAS